MNKIFNGIIFVLTFGLLGFAYFNFGELLSSYNLYSIIFIGVLTLIFIAGFFKAPKWANILQWITKVIILMLVISLSVFSIYYKDTIGQTLSSTEKYQSYIITKKNSGIKTIDDLNDGERIGVLRPGNIEAYDMPKGYLDTLNKNFVYEEQKYYQQMAYDLMDEKIDVIVLNSLSDATITDWIPNFKENIRVLKHLETTKTVETRGVKDVTKQPILIYISGIDTRDEIIDINTKSDVNMLLAFNPKTYTLDMISIPRDSYIPLPCENNEKDKLTYAGWQGVGCSIGAINNLLDIDINYYAKVNFYALTDLIEFYGRVTIDNTYDICLPSTVKCLKPGKVTLNKDEALEYSRIRHVDSDKDRTERQRILMVGLINETLNNFSIENINNLVKVMSSNVRTNIEAHNIFKLASFWNSHQNEIKINSYDITGKGQNIYLPYYKLTDYSKKLSSKSIEATKKRLYETIDKKYKDEKN